VCACRYSADERSLSRLLNSPPTAKLTRTEAHRCTQPSTASLSSWQSKRRGQMSVEGRLPRHTLQLSTPACTVAAGQIHSATFSDVGGASSMARPVSVPPAARTRVGFESARARVWTAAPSRERSRLDVAVRDGPSSGRSTGHGHGRLLAVAACQWPSAVAARARRAARQPHCLGASWPH
jgi:hypothetical protein